MCDSGERNCSKSTFFLSFKKRWILRSTNGAVALFFKWGWAAGAFFVDFGGFFLGVFCVFSCILSGFLMGFDGF